MWLLPAGDLVHQQPCPLWRCQAERFAPLGWHFCNAWELAPRTWETHHRCLYLGVHGCLRFTVKCCVCISYVMLGLSLKEVTAESRIESSICLILLDFSSSTVVKFLLKVLSCTEHSFLVIFYGTFSNLLSPCLSMTQFNTPPLFAPRFI